MVLANLPQSAAPGRISTNITSKLIEADWNVGFACISRQVGREFLGDAGPTLRNAPLFCLIVQEEGLAAKET